MSLLSTMAQQMVAQLSPDERAESARDIAMTMIRELSPDDRTDMVRLLVAELLRDVSAEQRLTLLRSALNEERVREHAGGNSDGR